MSEPTDIPIEDYALIGDMRSCALISRFGSIDWLCLPRHDGPAIFLRLLDPAGGRCWIEADHVQSAARRYLPASNVLETTFRFETGTLVVRDFMAVRSKPNVPGEGADSSAPGALVRRLRCSTGNVSAKLRVRPTFDFARHGTAVEQTAANDLAFFARDEPTMRLRIASSHAIAVEDDGAVIGVALRDGQEASLVLSGDKMPAEPAETLFEETMAYWHDWSARFSYRGGFREAVLRSALCLKLLTYAPTGAVVAAATAGLPEAAGGPRNWDYRFTWLRDSSFTVGAFLNLGYRHEAEEFLRFLCRADPSRGADLRILYPIDGVSLPEQSLDHLRGWRESRPVLIGNDAADQDQNDIYGEFLSALRLYLDEVGDDVPGNVLVDLPDLVRNLADAVQRRWTEVDRGIWEVRSASSHFFHSKAMCWVALDSAVHMTSRLGLPAAESKRWIALRDRIYKEVHERCWDEARQAYVAGYEIRELDAAVLRCTLFDANDPADPRLDSTIEAIERELTVGPHVYRYRLDDGLDGDEGAFVACSFWLAGNWALQGHTLKAQRRIAELIDCANDVGLLSEEVDPRTGAFLGNFPQGFSHMALINSAVRLEEAIARFGLR